MVLTRPFNMRRAPSLVEAGWPGLGSSRVAFRSFLWASVLVGLGACNTAYLEQRTDQPQDAADAVRATDLQPRYPQATGTIDTGGAGKPKSFTFFGWGGALPGAPAAQTSPASNDG